MLRLRLCQDKQEQRAKMVRHVVRHTQNRPLCGLIPGPGSIRDRLRIQQGLPGFADMPTANNIQIVGRK